MNIKKRGILLVILFLILLVLSVNFSLSEENPSGCYYFPGSEGYSCTNMLQSDAKLDCDDYVDCDFNQYFATTLSCTDVPECNEVTCIGGDENFNCQTINSGRCEYLNGQVVNDNEYSQWCNQGCCKIYNQDACAPLDNLLECQNLAKSYLGSGFTVNDYVFNTNYIGQQCVQDYCQQELNTIFLNGTINNINGDPLIGAEVNLVGRGKRTLTDNAGNYEFYGLLPGDYQIEVIAGSYLKTTITATLSINSTKNFVLAELGETAKIYGTVQENVRIAWDGPVSGSLITDNSNTYEILDLPLGTYSISATKSFYSPFLDIINLSSDTILNIILQEQTITGLTGTTYIDYNEDNQLQIDENEFGINLYLDGNYKGRSTYPNGEFNINLNGLTIGDDFVFSAKIKLNGIQYLYEKSLTFDGQPLEINPLLTAYIGECSLDGTEKVVDEGTFIVKPVPGKKVLEISWNRPCLEVIDYRLERFDVDNPENGIVVPHSQGIYFDNDVEWDKNYYYEITAIYENGREAGPIQSEIVNVGNQICEDKYYQDTGLWREFCDSTKKFVLTCNDKNVLKDPPLETCIEQQFCAPNGLYEATCKDSGQCKDNNNNNNLFGLEYTQKDCYKTTNPLDSSDIDNFCFYDFSNSTIVNQCSSCEEINSCFDYQSKNSCEINSCFATDCNWIEGPLTINNQLFVGYQNILMNLFEETGQGYCVEEGYKSNNEDPEGDDFCNLCGPDSLFLENFFCTAEVCSNLGNCFSQTNMETCETCGDQPSSSSNCYTYETELECIGNQPFEVNDFAKLTFSKDSCNWGRCVWTGGSCIKDGDGNNNDDCTDGDINCKIDIDAPTTILENDDYLKITLESPEVSFKTTDNDVLEIHYCLTEVGVNDCDKDNFETKQFNRNVNVNLLNTAKLNGQLFDGETFILKYYSVDKNFNREDLKQVSVYVDNVKPIIDQINYTYETENGLTNLKVILDKEQNIVCNLILEPVVTHETSKTPQDIDNTEFIFNDLIGSTYNLDITCTDPNENILETNEPITFDLETNINIIYPPFNGYIAKKSFPFKVETITPTTCELLKDGQFFENFNSQDGYNHQTINIQGFGDGNYHGIYSVVCTDTSSEIYEDWFAFVIDSSPPETEIALTENEREVIIPYFKFDGTLNYGWQNSFISSVNISFQCPVNSVVCEDNYYCLGNDCRFSTPSSFTKFTNTLTLNETSLICYYSTNEAGLRNTAICGTINIDGHGIVLEKPQGYTYLGDLWGISNKDIFNIQFETKRPAIECKYSFNSNFDYNNVPNFRKIPLNTENKFVISNFPESASVNNYPSKGGIKTIYVKCINNLGEIGEEQEIFLEYDPTAPYITKSYVNPNPVVEGTVTNLYVETDDKTLCKYSDNSENSGSDEYLTMEYSFPGSMNNILRTEHNDRFNLNFVGTSKNYKLNTICKNGANNFSEINVIDFLVDYSILGNIISLAPNGYLNQKSVTLNVETNKLAVCKFRDNKTSQQLTSTDGYSHSFSLTNLAEKEYIFPVKCNLGDHVVEGQINFNIDLTSPEIKRIDDGNYSCGRDKLNVMVYTDEESLSLYEYEVYQKKSSRIIPSTSKSSSTSKYTRHRTSRFANITNNKSYSRTSSTSSTKGDVLIFNNTIIAGDNKPLEIPLNGLNDTFTYYVKVRVQDTAGNWGKFKTSNGFKIVDKNYTKCEDKNFHLEFDTNKTCTSVSVQLRCQSDNGCKVKYGLSSSSRKCQPSLSYNGENVLLDKTTWICYTIENNANKIVTSKKLITIPDADSDGIFDDCDNCQDTSNGKIVDDEGCADGQLNNNEKIKDTDKDGLPDIWENNYNKTDCIFNFNNSDSDNNGILDSMEDYDDDGYTSFQEYKLNFDPCKKDESLPKDEEKNPEIRIPQSSEPDYLAWIFLIMGTLMVIGGTTYLIYYYNYSFQSKTLQRKQVGLSRRLPSGKIIPSVQRNMVNKQIINPPSWTDKLFNLKKKHELNQKKRARKNLFSEFGQNSPLPHLNKIINKDISHREKLQQLTEKYSGHHKEIKKNLNPGEKRIFNKLHNISDKAKGKEIKKIISEKEAKDIFYKLKQINEKRKNKK